MLAGGAAQPLASLRARTASAAEGCNEPQQQQRGRRYSIGLQDIKREPQLTSVSKGCLGHLVCWSWEARSASALLSSRDPNGNECVEVVDMGGLLLLAQRNFVSRTLRKTGGCQTSRLSLYCIQSGVEQLGVHCMLRHCLYVGYFGV